MQILKKIKMKFGGPLIRSVSEILKNSSG